MNLGEQILNLKLEENDSGQDTIKGYLKELLNAVWDQGEGFSGKRPFGNSGWKWDLYPTLINNGFIKGKVDENGFVIEIQDETQAEEFISLAIEAL